MKIRMKDEYYEAADKAIKAMNRENVEAFGRLKLTDWDKVNIIQTIAAVYQEQARRARRRYYEVGFEAYVLGLILCGEEPRKAHEEAEKAISPEWVEDILEQTDFVTLYRFNSEVERKVYRLAEAVEVAADRNYEVDKALRFWSQQLGQYAINVTDYAVVQAFMDYGVEMVEWETAADELVCNECTAYDHQVFRINELPPKPHWGCRCKIRPVFRNSGD